MIKIAPEGYPFIAVFSLLTAGVWYITDIWFSVLPAVITLFMIYFFRDPERHVPQEKDIFVSPADGKVIVVKDVYESEYLNTDVKQISIFMSPFDVHVNRVPCDGKVKKINHTAGSFMAAYKEDASIKNEKIDMVLETRYGDILVRQVAGFIARRVVCRVDEGDILIRGERYGIIKFSSRLDVFLPLNTSIRVNVGDRVRSGETVIGAIIH